MRLGCEATAIDINPVAWFILKCTLEYPQKLAGQKLPLPGFRPQVTRNSWRRTSSRLAAARSIVRNCRSRCGASRCNCCRRLTPISRGTCAHGGYGCSSMPKNSLSAYRTYADYQPLQGEFNTSHARRDWFHLIPTAILMSPRSNVDDGEEYLKNPQNPRSVPRNRLSPTSGSALSSARTAVDRRPENALALQERKRNGPS